MNCFGKIIVFSGIDGAGKSTQIDLLKNELKKKNKKTVVLWTRGGYTFTISLIKSILRKWFKKKLPPPGRSTKRQEAFKKSHVRNLWLLLAIIDLILIYAIYFRLLKFFGYIIIADRYLFDTYIDFQLNIPNSSIDTKLSWKLLNLLTPKADAYLLLLIPVSESLKRSKLKDEPFPDSPETLENRLDYYHKFEEREYVTSVDCMTTIDNVQEKVQKAVLQIL